MKAHLVYRLQYLVFADAKRINFREPFQFWPIHKNLALVLPGNGWPSVFPAMATGDITRIGYSINATNEKICVGEHFEHEVKKACKIVGNYLHGAPLFTSVDAAWLLKTPGLKPLRAIQFVC